MSTRPLPRRLPAVSLAALAPVLAAALALALSLAPSAAAPALAGPQAKPKTVKDLPPQYRTWLDQDVRYIITNRERDVFLQLGSDREREIFIQAFWKQRDPDPITEKNEFREEHYRRIAYANQWYGRDTPTPGWRTDMGRIYIILGEPKSVERYENVPEIYPTIIWFYDGMAEYGLPGSFNVVFFKREGTNEYILYSPVKYGPQNLLVHYKGDMTQIEQAYAELANIEPNVAEVSVSLIPGETNFALTPSLASEVLLNARIPAAATIKVKDDYAEKLLRYKDLIEVDYTANYVDSEAAVRVFRDPAGTAFVHYLIEPKSLKFVEEEPGRYRADLVVNGNVTDAKATDPAKAQVYQFERQVPIVVNNDQLARIKAKLFSFQDLFPISPGRYKISVLLKNRVSREFTSFEAEIAVPEAGAFSMSEPLLSNSANKDSKYKGANKPFLVGGVQLVPSPRNDFTVQDTMGAYVELRNPPADVAAGGGVAYTFLKIVAPAGEGSLEAVRTVEKKLADYPDPGRLYEEFPLAGLQAAHYRLRVAVRSASGAERLAAETSFYISPVFVLPRPWVLSVSQPPPGDPALAHALGVQALAKDELAEAAARLGEAYKKDPKNVTYALDYCRLLSRRKDYQAVKETAAPFLADEKARADFLQIAGEAFQALGEFGPAIAAYKDYLTRFGTHIPVLNAIGECYLGMGNAAEALAAWERSLQLEPNQPALKERIRAIKDKK